MTVAAASSDWPDNHLQQRFQVVVEFSRVIVRTDVAIMSPTCPILFLHVGLFWPLAERRSIIKIKQFLYYRFKCM